jgi:hypothetical protein
MILRKVQGTTGSSLMQVGLGVARDAASGSTATAVTAVRNETHRPTDVCVSTAIKRGTTLSTMKAGSTQTPRGIISLTDSD